MKKDVNWIFFFIIIFLSITNSFTD